MSSDTEITLLLTNDNDQLAVTTDYLFKIYIMDLSDSSYETGVISAATLDSNACTVASNGEDYDELVCQFSTATDIHEIVMTVSGLSTDAGELVSTADYAGKY